MRCVHGRVRALGTLPLAVVLLGCGGGPTAPEPEDLAILFIGNSLTYANDLPDLVKRLLEEGGAESVVVESAAYPNFGLQDHWVMGEARAAIDRGGWDFVVMQQGPSATEGRPSLLEYSQMFAEEIRRVGAQPALYMVWPSDARSFDFDGVSDSYRTAAELSDGLLFPAGEAWRAAWRRDATLPLYSGDGFHPSPMGSYLAALVMVEQIAGIDPRTLPTTAGDVDLSAEVVAVLQEAAVEANAEHALTVGG